MGAIAGSLGEARTDKLVPGVRISVNSNTYMANREVLSLDRDRIPAPFCVIV